MIRNVDVAIKVSPLMAQDHEKNKNIEWEIQDSQIIKVNNPNKKRKHFVGNEFLFDNIFNSQHKNLDVYESTIKKIVELTIHGVNGTIIAYGHSGSGKTHTMYGTPQDPGIITLSINYIFDKANEMSRTNNFSFKLSCFEIQNEKINDMLDINNTNLRLKKSINDLVQVIGCKEEIVTDAKSALDILERCEENRKTYEHLLPEKSDKSHRVVRISIENINKESDSYYHHRFSQLNLVDLAGYKTINNNESKEDNSNMSLILLNIINVQLNKASDVKKNINFKGSKLTECLLTALGGNSMTAFICTLSLTALEESQRTLWFAAKAKNIVNKPIINTVLQYKYKLEIKICKFHKSLKQRIKMLLDELIRMQKDSKVTNQENKNYCCLSYVIKKINDDSSKLGTKPMPVIDESDIFSALGEFKQDLEKLHQKLASFIGATTSTENVLPLLQSIESDIDKIEPKAVLLETFVNILMTAV